MARPHPPTLGFQDDTALQTPGPVRDRLLAEMRAQHAKAARINVIYGRVKAEGWGKIDDEVNALRARGIAPQITIMGTPSYAPQWDQGIGATRNNPRAWQQWAGEVAHHFKGRVGTYSIGNEPNWPSFIAGADKNPRAAGRTYRGVYRGGRSGIKGVDRHARVLVGELSSAPNAKAFLKSFLGGKPIRTEGLAYHPYAGGGAWDINSLDELQATLGRYKRQGRLQTVQGKQAPLYLTEFGTQKGTMSDTQRLRVMGRAYAKAKQAGARQLIAYQLMPTQRPMTTEPGGETVDGYSGTRMTFGGRRIPTTGFVWDTGIADASGNIPVINRGMKLSQSRPRARAAKARRKRG